MRALKPPVGQKPSGIKRHTGRKATIIFLSSSLPSSQNVATVLNDQKLG